MLAEVKLPDPEIDLRPLSPSAVRRPAAARGHRHGADGRAVAAGHGRADHGPRRHRRGGGARSRARPPARSTTPPSSSSATISAPSCASATASASCMRASWWRRGRSARCSAIRATPIPAACSNAFPCSAADKHSSPLVPIPGPGAAGPEPAAGLHLRVALQACASRARCTAGRIADDRRARRVRAPRAMRARARAAAAGERPQGAVDAEAVESREPEMCSDVDQSAESSIATSTSIFSGGESYEVKALNDISMSAPSAA